MCTEHRLFRLKTVSSKFVVEKFLVFSEYQLVTTCLLLVNISSRVSLVKTKLFLLIRWKDLNMKDNRKWALNMLKTQYNVTNLVSLAACFYVNSFLFLHQNSNDALHELKHYALNDPQQAT